MSQVNYHMLDNSVVITFNGQRFLIHTSDKRFQQIKQAIIENDLEAIPGIVSKVTTAVNEYQEFEIRDNCLWLDGKMVDDSIAEKVIKFSDEGLPIDPLLKFIRKLRNNPSFNSRKQLYAFLVHNGHPITSEGNFIAYRGITSDFKDCHTQTFDNSIGAVCAMERDLVDDNPNNTCSSGFHVACYDYAQSFGAKVVEVEVDPRDVVCVPADYNGTKMRVCKFKVTAECEKLNESDLVDSSYADSFLSELDTYDTDSDDENNDYDTLDHQETVQVLFNSSSFIESAIWNQKTKDLTVTFKKGHKYVYACVPLAVVVQWEQAISGSEFFNDEIVNNYSYVRCN